MIFFPSHVQSQNLPKLAKALSTLEEEARKAVWDLNKNNSQE